MAKHTSLSALFKAIADAIRSKTGGTDNIVADDFPEAIKGIPSGGGNSDSTFTYTWRGTKYKFYFLPGQTWDEWFNDTTHANKDSALVGFYGSVGISASIDWVQESDGYGYDVADMLMYPDMESSVMSHEEIQPIEYGVSYWNS